MYTCVSFVSGLTEDRLFLGSQSTEMEEDSWHENYFVDRDERDRLVRLEEEASTIPITLPIKEQRRRNGGLLSLTQNITRGQRSRALGYRSRSPAITLHHCPVLNRMMVLPTDVLKVIVRDQQLMDLLKSVVPELTSRSDEWRSANRMVQNVMREDAIHFSMNFIAMDDDSRMIRAYVAQVRRSLTRSPMIYVGITENPVRRFHMHLENYGPVINMLIVRVRFTSAETAYWEKHAIRRFREDLGYGSLLNRGDGGERASAGRPHYGYILTMP